MDPTTDALQGLVRRFPRTRGDGPWRNCPITASVTFPPHARGWTVLPLRDWFRSAVSPARAGMDPATHREERRPTSFPRTRGDGPAPQSPQRRTGMFPTHARGWTPSANCRNGGKRVSPARAGMDPPAAPVGHRADGFPRTRGDGPLVHGELGYLAMFPPHARGWTVLFLFRRIRRVVSPARAGMDRTDSRSEGSPVCFPRTRGDGPMQDSSALAGYRFPPHARGWTRCYQRGERWVPVSPARAGMDPSGRSDRTGTTGFPRTRGDGPNPITAALASLAFPPHARGWTLHRVPAPGNAGVSPARAGMDPGSVSWRAIPLRFPRTRGDGPAWVDMYWGAESFPPHARGWTLSPSRTVSVTPVSPARAGMDPAMIVSLLFIMGFPRTCGDGPRRTIPARVIEMFPPHVRGWTLAQRSRTRYHVVSPARAGMDLRHGSISRTAWSFPRTRGDGPKVANFNPTFGLFPPHARGWTPASPPPRGPVRVSPARAGMDRARATAARDRACFSRTRGDGPNLRPVTREEPAVKRHLKLGHLATDKTGPA